MPAPIPIRGVKTVAEARRRIPPADFVGAQYDIDHGVPTSDVLVILSTPRSGSTLLCELLRLHGACLAHEYLQPGQYMPLLAERWHASAAGTLDEPTYIASLRRYRTYPNGWLGLNLHGSHLPYFVRMERHFAGARMHYVHLQRADLIAQAISYHIATQTGQWSSEFPSGRQAEYDFTRIEDRLTRIQAQNALIRAFLAGRQARSLTLHYEDVAADPASALRQLPCVGDEAGVITPGLRRQASPLSDEWATRFAREYLERNLDTGPRSRFSVAEWIRNLLGRRR